VQTRGTSCELAPVVDVNNPQQSDYRPRSFGDEANTVAEQVLSGCVAIRKAAPPLAQSIFPATAIRVSIPTSIFLL
jgi:hypothetical protein